MGRRTVWTAAVAASIALAGCTTIPVRIDQNAQLLATVHCQSVGWAGGFKGDSPLRSSIANPLNEARLRDAIAANLQIAHIPLMDTPAPGAAAAGEQGARCLIGYGIGMQQQIDSVYPAGWGYGAGYYGRGWGPGWGGYGWGYGWGAPYVYHTSFITLDLYDAASREPLWHASAEQSLSGLSGDAATQHIRAAVDAIFLKFPR